MDNGQVCVLYHFVRRLFLLVDSVCVLHSDRDLMMQKQKQEAEAPVHCPCRRGRRPQDSLRPAITTVVGRDTAKFSGKA